MIAVVLLVFALAMWVLVLAHAADIVEAKRSDPDYNPEEDYDEEILKP